MVNELVLQLRRLQTENDYLRQKVIDLRASRRVLMDLLAAQDRDRNLLIDELQSENRRLRSKSKKYSVVFRLADD